MAACRSIAPRQDRSVSHRKLQSLGLRWHQTALAKKSIHQIGERWLLVGGLVLVASTDNRMRNSDYTRKVDWRCGNDDLCWTGVDGSRECPQLNWTISDCRQHLADMRKISKYASDLGRC